VIPITCSTMGSKDRVLEFFKENVGRVVTTEDLAYVAKGVKEFDRLPAHYQWLRNWEYV